jgi:hypothetical protein
MEFETITQEVYYYIDDDGNRVIDEELVLEEFKDKLAKLLLSNMGIA